jgi:hypothetical protein
MKRTPLKIPTNKDPFEDVSFVNDMTPAAMRKLIKDMWANIQALAAHLDNSRPDISGVLDKILDGLKWDEKEIDDRFWFGTYKGFNIRWDTLTKQMTLMDENHDPIEEPIPAISGDTIMSQKAQRKA